MRAIWTGSISFGLVNIPIKMYSGSRSHEGLHLNMLHAKDKSPIRYSRVCRQDGQEIPFNEIVKGYEYQHGDYIVLDKKDFEKADAKKTQALEIKQFVDEKEIDSRYYDKPYYLEPDKKADRAYALLRDALQKSGKVALVKYAMRARDNIGALKPIGGALVLNQMRFPADVREFNDLNLPASDSSSEGETDMALALINQQTRPFIPEDWHDEYTEELEDIIKEKAKGHEPTQHGTAPKETKVQDLMATLKASLEK
jgi:DNA end-binding protein Ku